MFWNEKNENFKKIGLFKTPVTKLVSFKRPLEL